MLPPLWLGYLVGCAALVFAADAQFQGLKEWRSARSSIRDRLFEELGSLALSDVQHVHFESMLASAAKEYDLVGAPPRSQTHLLVFAVKRQNEERAAQLLDELSQPSSPRYGQHLSREEAYSLIENPQSTLHLRTYLEQNGATIEQVTPWGDFVAASAPVAVWEDLLHCQFGIYTSRHRKDVSVTRAARFSLEATVVHHVQAVLGLTHLPDPHAVPRLRPDTNFTVNTGSVSGRVVPSVLNGVYGIDSASRKGRKGSQGVYESLGQTYAPADLTAFEARNGLPLSAVASNVGGGPDPNQCADPNYCVEATLDLQYMLAVAPLVHTTYFSWNDNSDFMVGWLLQVSAMPDPPKVLSISYGADEDYISPAYAQAFDSQAVLLGLQGVTIVVSSGDDGAPGARAKGNPMFCGYRSSFPASSSYVTALGGTMGPESGKSEVSCQSDRGGVITSGGGFSALYPTPSFQSAQTAGYLTVTSPVPGFASGGRGIPDLALLATNYEIVIGGQLALVSGTSASAPVFAAMVSLVNAARLELGKGPLGWLNPALYQLAGSFTKDVTVGHNHCTAGGLVCCAQGFSAAKGWDPVTGLGSVDFQKFKSAFVALGSGPSFAPTRAPMRSPTPKPTPAAPLSGEGWLSLITYDEEACAGEPVLVDSVVANTCLPSRRGSVAYVCEDTRIVIRQYSDAECSAEWLTAQSTVGLGCAYRVQDYYYAPHAHSTQLLCSKDASSPALPSTNQLRAAHYLHKEFVSAATCEHGQPCACGTALTDHCYNDGAVSYMYSAGSVLVYVGADCIAQNLALTEALSTSCKDSGDGGDDDDGVILHVEAWVTSASPSPRPSARPSTEPASSSARAPQSGPGFFVLGFLLTFLPILTLSFGACMYLFFPERLPGFLVKQKKAHPSSSRKFRNMRDTEDSPEDGLVLNPMQR